MYTTQLGNESAIEGFKKPFERELHTHESLVARAQECGISLKTEPAKGDEGEDAPDDLLAARIMDFIYTRPAPGRRVTSVGPSVENRIDIAFREIVAPGGIWERHAAKGSKPTWVESDSPELAKMLGDYYGCPVGRPEGWQETRSDETKTEG